MRRTGRCSARRCTRSCKFTNKKAASDACGYPDSPTRLLREVPQAPFEHRFSICGCAFISGPRAAFGGWPPKRSLRRVWRTLLTATSSPLAVVFFFLLRLGRLHRQDPIHIVLDGQQLPHSSAGLPVFSVSRFLVRQQLGVLGLKLLDGGQFLHVQLIEGFLGRLVQPDLILMLRVKFPGVSGLSVGHSGAACTAVSFRGVCSFWPERTASRSPSV